MDNNLIYIASGRSVSKSNPGTKIRSILSCWQEMGFPVEAVFGGDLPGGTVAPEGDYGETSYYGKWYRRSPMLDPLVRSMSEWRDIGHNRATVCFLRGMIRAMRPSLIWERSSRLHNAGLQACREAGIPYVLEWKDNLIPYRNSLFRRHALAMERRKNRDADFIVVESGVLCDELVREGVDGSKIIIAHNAVDAGRFIRNPADRERKRHELGVADDEVLVGYLGSYAFYHDAVRLVLAADILRRLEYKIRILMVGNGEEYAFCHAMAEDKGLREPMFMMRPGIPGKEVPELLAALDVAVLPGSTDIICPIKIQEYMAAGLPALAPDYPCNREVIEDRVSGMLFNPKDEHSLAESLVWLAGSRSRRERLGSSARKVAEERFSWEMTWGSALREVFSRIRQ